MVLGSAMDLMVISLVSLNKLQPEELIALPDGKNLRTSTGSVETSLLAHESLVLHCMPMSLAVVLLRFESCAPSAILLSVSFPPMCGEHTLGAEELSGDVERLAADNDDLLAVQELLGDSAGQATEQVSLAIDNDLYGHSS